MHYYISKLMTVPISQPISSIITDRPGLTTWRLLRVETHREIDGIRVLSISLYKNLKD